MESLTSDEIYSPGDKICLANHARTGYGTYVRDGYIYASLLGRAKIEREQAVQSSDKTATGSSQPTVSIKTFKDNSVVIPLIGGLVIARITNVNPRYAKCLILSVNNCVLKDYFPGQINRKDIRATEKDKIEISKSFRCGDVIIARVISLGDTNSYFLSCAENELGVVIGHSEAGSRMIPVSWNEMQCPVTMLKEPRKVAKVQPDFIDYIEQEDKDEQSEAATNGMDDNK